MTLVRKSSSTKRVGALAMVLALSVLVAGCDGTRQPHVTDPDAEANCRQEGFDPGTTEYENCISEISAYDREEE